MGRTDAEAGAPILWPPDVKSRLIGKDPDIGKDGGQEEKGATENETVRWHHQFNGHESEQTPGNSEGQGSLECCSLWGHKELDMTELLNKNNIELIPGIPHVFLLQGDDLPLQALAHQLLEGKSPEPGEAPWRVSRTLIAEADQPIGPHELTFQFWLIDPK